MQTREDLIGALARATEILQAAENLQDDINRCRASFPLQFAASDTVRNLKTSVFRKKHMGIIGTVVLYLVIMCTLSSFAGRAVFPILKTILNFVSLVAAVPITLLIRKWINRRRDEKNEARDARAMESQQSALEQMERIRENRQTLLDQLEQIFAAYNQEIRPWLPDEYSYSQATSYMLGVIRNGRADSLKEAMNLFETAMHQRRMEAGQQQIIQNQFLQTAIMQSEMSALREEIASMPPPVTNVYNNYQQTNYNTNYHTHHWH